MDVVIDPGQGISFYLYNINILIYYAKELFFFIEKEEAQNTEVDINKEIEDDETEEIELDKENLSKVEYDFNIDSDIDE